MVTIHDPKSDTECLCGRAFTRPKNLRNHIKTLRIQSDRRGGERRRALEASSVQGATAGLMSERPRGELYD